MTGDRRVRRPRVTKSVRSRLERLLDMRYRPSELAEELGVCADTVRRSWLRAGVPHVRDEQGVVWLMGTEVAAWLESQANTATVTLGPGEAYCLQCRAAVAIEDAQRESQEHAVLVRGRCALCGARVARLEKSKVKSPESQVGSQE